MKLIILLLMALSAANSKPSKQDTCTALFSEENFSQVIRQCEAISKDSVEMEFIYFAALMFMDVSADRINYIFYNGKQVGSYLYKYRTGNSLYTNMEKYHLKNHFPKLAAYADQGIPLAQLLTAKVFYINVDIIKIGEEDERSSASYDEFKSGMAKFYLPNLEKIVAVEPNHVEALVLLGLESFNPEYIEGQYESRTKYYSIKDEKLYAYMLRAHQLGHPGLQEVIDGVAAWDKHIQAIEKQAKNQDPDAIYKLGQNAYRKSHDDKRYLDDAFKYYLQAAELGHEDALRSVNSFYGNQHYDKEKYLSTLKQLVNLNDTKAMLRLGDIYLCNQRTAEAKALYEKALILKDPIAQYALDDLKYDGEPSLGCR